MALWDEGRGELEKFCRAARQPSIGEASPFNHFISPEPDQLLRASVGLGFRRARLQHVYSILRGKDLETGVFSEERRIAQFSVLKESQAYALNLQNWHEFLKVLVRAGFRNGPMISSKTAIIYTYVFFLIGKKHFATDPYDLRNLIARWFFMCSLTSRYSSSPETAMEQDLNRLRGIKDGAGFIAMMNQIIQDTLIPQFVLMPFHDGTAHQVKRAMFGGGTEGDQRLLVESKGRQSVADALLSLGGCCVNGLDEGG